MKNQLNCNNSGGIRGALAVAALAVIWGASAVPDAQASFSAGNTIVRNTITVNYSDAKNVAQAAVSASVDVTVVTVAATPSFTFMPTSLTGSTDGSTATLTYNNVRVRTNSNGPGTISFATSDGTFVNVGAGAAPSVPGNINLGATVIDPSEAKRGAPQTVIATGNIVFAVPADGAGTAGLVNGLATGAIVYLYDGTTPYGPFTVGTVTNPAPPAIATNTPVTPGSIQLINNTVSSIGPFTPQYGWQIVEAKDVSVTVTQGVVPIATAQNLSTWTTTVSATMAGAPAGTGTIVTTAHAGQLTVTKYVRNVTQYGTMTGTTPFPGNPLTINSGSFNYWKTGITGKPGDTLEYLAVITDSGTGNSTAVLATDTVPPYVNLVNFPTSYGASPGSGIIFAHAKLGAIETDLKTDNTMGNVGAAYGKTAAVTVGPLTTTTMTFYLGSGLTASPVTGGLMTPAQTAYVIYQMKID
jgi:hypothetical protein